MVGRVAFAQAVPFGFVEEDEPARVRAKAKKARETAMKRALTSRTGGPGPAAQIRARARI